MVIIPEDLTEEQKAAMNGYFNNPKRLFYGMSPEYVIDIFRDVNDARSKNEKDRADRREKEWFEILKYKKSDNQ